MYRPHLGIYIELGISRYRLEPDDHYVDSDEHYMVAAMLDYSGVRTQQRCKNTAAVWKHNGVGTQQCK